MSDRQTCLQLSSSDCKQGFVVGPIAALLCQKNNDIKTSNNVNVKKKTSNKVEKIEMSNDE